MFPLSWRGWPRLDDSRRQGRAIDPRAVADRALDTDGDGYTDIEEYLNGTDPTQFVDYTLPKNNINTLGAGSSTLASSTINR